MIILRITVAYESNRVRVITGFAGLGLSDRSILRGGHILGSSSSSSPLIAPSVSLNRPDALFHVLTGGNAVNISTGYVFGRLGL